MTALRRLGWPLLAFLAAACVFALLWATDGWNAWGVPRMWPWFADLYAELAALDCHRQGYDVLRENPCDPLGRPHVYGSIWLWLAPLGSTVHDAVRVGLPLAATTGLAAALVAFPRDAAECALTVMVLASPAVLLGFERGNNDLLVFLGVASGVFLAVRAAGPWRWAGALPLWLAAVLKIYPLAAVAALAGWARERRGAWRYWGRYWTIVGLCATSWLALHWREILLLRETVPVPTERYALGGVHFFMAAGLGSGPVLVPVLFAALVALALALARRWPIRPAAHDGLAVALFVAGWAMLAFCFVATSNYDYRTVFFVLTLPLLFSIRRAEPGWRGLVHLAFVALGVMLWSEAFVGLAGRGGLTGLAAAIGIVEHALAWLLFLPLTVLAWCCLLAPRAEGRAP